MRLAPGFLMGGVFLVMIVAGLESPAYPGRPAYPGAGSSAIRVDGRVSSEEGWGRAVWFGDRDGPVRLGAVLPAEALCISLDVAGDGRRDARVEVRLGSGPAVTVWPRPTAGRGVAGLPAVAGVESAWRDCLEARVPWEILRADGPANLRVRLEMRGRSWTYPRAGGIPIEPPGAPGFRLWGSWSDPEGDVRMPAPPHISTPMAQSPSAQVEPQQAEFTEHPSRWDLLSCQLLGSSRGEVRLKLTFAPPTSPLEGSTAPVVQAYWDTKPGGRGDGLRGVPAGLTGPSSWEVAVDAEGNRAGLYTKSGTRDLAGAVRWNGAGDEMEIGLPRGTLPVKPRGMLVIILDAAALAHGEPDAVSDVLDPTGTIQAELPPPDIVVGPATSRPRLAALPVPK